MTPPIRFASDTIPTSLPRTDPRCPHLPQSDLVPWCHLTDAIGRPTPSPSSYTVWVRSDILVPSNWKAQFSCRDPYRYVTRFPQPCLPVASPPFSLSPDVRNGKCFPCISILRRSFAVSLIVPKTSRSSPCSLVSTGWQISTVWGRDSRPLYLGRDPPPCGFSRPLLCW